MHSESPVDVRVGAVPTGLAPRRLFRFALSPWRRYLILAALLTLLYFLRPESSAFLWLSLGMSCVIATVVAIIRYKPERRAAWYLLAGAELTFISGDTAYRFLTQVLHQDNPFPSIADGFYLLTYPLFAAGLFLFIRGRSSTRDRASLIDALIITTSLGLLSWVYLVMPNFQAPGLTGAQRFISVAYPLGDILVLAMLARLVGGGGLRLRSMQFLVVGANVLIVSDALYGLSQLNGNWQTGGPIDVGWAAFYAAWGCAALHPSMGRLGAKQPVRSVPVGRFRVSLLAGVMLIAPAVLFADSVAADPGVEHSGTVAVFSAVISLLVIARLWGILGVHQQAVQRERALRSFSGSLVAAQGLPDIYRTALEGVDSLTGTAEVSRAGIYLVADDVVTCVAHSGRRGDVARYGELRQEALAGGSLSASGTLSVTPLRYDLEDRGMLVVETSTPLTPDQHASLTALAAQVVLALESANLAESLRQRQGEARFRGILQNTTDIILIVNRRGEITYGTPSLGRSLGRAVEDVLGRELAEFLHPGDAAEATAMFASYASPSGMTQSSADWHLRHCDGTSVAFEVLSNNLLDDTQVAGIVLTMRDVSERRALEARLKHQAFHDPLTGLPNRALFWDRTAHAMARTARSGGAIAMLIIDLDDFKMVNDTHGHAAGDELLLHVATRLQATFRAGATVARFGGDEFAVLVEDVDEASHAVGLADRALAAFGAAFTVLGEDLRVGASIGLAVTAEEHDALEMTELMRCADLALYAAKERGKGQVVCYDEDLNTRMLDRLTRRTDLEHALESDEFVLLYQPIVSIETGEISGCEALVRWKHPGRGLLPPIDFVELAEETGLIVELGAWALDTACAQLKSWADAGHLGLRMSVNVSARQLREATFVDVVRAALRRHHVYPGQLVLELTESIFALDPPAVSEQLLSLRDAGVKLAIDDFGTGYSSLAYLQRLQLDILKIDKAFVDRLGSGNPDASALVNAIISLSQSLRLEVVAEGIEKPGQRDELWSMGCRVGQGFLYSRPVSADRMSSFLTEPALAWQAAAAHGVAPSSAAYHSVPTPARRPEPRVTPTRAGA